MLFWQSRLPSRSMRKNWMNCDVKNRTPVPLGTGVLFSCVRWSADESDFRELRCQYVLDVFLLVNQSGHPFRSYHTETDVRVYSKSI